LRTDTIFYAALVCELSTELIDTLVEFPLIAWFIIVIKLIVESMLYSDHACLDTDIVKFFFYLCSGSATIFMALRLTIFKVMMARGRPNDTLPCSAFDRIFCLFIGPAVTGLLPFLPARPRYAMWSIQCVLWYEAMTIAQLIEARISFAMGNANPGTVSELHHSSVSLVMGLSILLVWALVLLPHAIEMFCLPPYLDNEQAKQVLHVLKAYPDGCVCVETGLATGDTHSAEMSDYLKEAGRAVGQPSPSVPSASSAPSPEAAEAGTKTEGI